jgi:hypothetical protein
LKFKDRNIKPSNKNFQLIDEKNENNILLQFAEINKNNDNFILDFKFPFTEFSAFAIAIIALLVMLLIILMVVA